MTELMESIAIGVFNAGGTRCPFDHTNPKPPTVKNYFIGDGGILGKKLEAGDSTILYEPLRKSASQEVYPETDEDEPIKIDGFTYPVTCAAHHLIPAQESLKKVKALHDWMVHKDEPEPLTSGETSGIVWADVGYDVNGAENGVWLPGNYAVGGNGTGEWTYAPSALADNEEASVRTRRKPKTSSSKLTGLRHEIEDDNRKWQYVKQATKEFRAQFHDRHRDYSDFVIGILEKLAALYADRKIKSETSCNECKERIKKFKKLGIPTPFILSQRLNGVSTRLRRYLVGKRGHKIVYASNWGKAAADNCQASFKD